jgi:hypothetical protein
MAMTIANTLRSTDTLGADETPAADHRNRPEHRSLRHRYTTGWMYRGEDNTRRWLRR